MIDESMASSENEETNNNDLDQNNADENKQDNSVNSSESENSFAETNSSENNLDKTEDSIKRIGMLKKRHEREVAQMNAKIAELTDAIQKNQYSSHQPGMYGDNGNLIQNPYTGEMIDKNSPAGQALLVQQQKSDYESHLQHERTRAHAQELEKQTMDSLFDSMDEASLKYNDYDAIVRANDAPFTEAIVNTVKFMPNPGEVLYLLGKNRKLLSQLSKLNPVQQAQEVVKHVIELNNKNTISRAPAPVSPVDESLAKVPSKLADLDYQSLKQHYRDKARRRK